MGSAGTSSMKAAGVPIMQEKWVIHWNNRMRPLLTLLNQVIDAMLRDELLKFQDQIARQSRKQKRKKLGYFKEIQFTQADWMQIKHLNDELKVSDNKTLPIWIIYYRWLYRYASLSIFLPRKWRVMDLPVPLFWPIIIKRSKIWRRRKQLVQEKTPFIRCITRW